MSTHVYRLDTAHIQCRDSILSLGGDEQSTTLIGCFAFLVDHEGEYILIDCGIEDLELVNGTKSSVDMWSRYDTEGTVLQEMEKVGISPERVQRVFLTHSHYDHISAVTHFKKAKIYMSAKEYDFLRCESNPQKNVLSEVISFLMEKDAAHDLFLIDNEYRDGDIKCAVVGGHTPGSMLVYIDDFLFTGDSVFLKENIKDCIPIGFTASPQESYEAVKQCGLHSGYIMTGHDMKTLKKV